MATCNHRRAASEYYIGGQQSGNGLCVHLFAGGSVPRNQYNTHLNIECLHQNSNSGVSLCLNFISN